MIELDCFVPCPSPSLSPRGPAFTSVTSLLQCICIPPDAVGGGRHIAGLQSINIHKEEEKATTSFSFQANVMDEAVPAEEYVFKCNY